LDARGFTAQGVLGALLQMEAAFGRVRSARNAPRTLDLDVLDFAGQALNLPGLSVPHPRLKERLFVLEPLSALWPHWRHPISGERAIDLYHALQRNAAPKPIAG
jgi:2-amino-4-hydroxy-6-hydroxymethyldihydropteridine diphosphokinase